MPELPEVETVRDGLARWAVGRSISAVEIRHPRAIRRHLPGADDLAARLTGRTIEAARRRGKFLWLVLSDDLALVIHLGMSGQVLVQRPDAPDEKHLHVRISLVEVRRRSLETTDPELELRFVDQRTFGGVLLDELVDGVPTTVAHIARDPLDPLFDDAAFIARLRRRNSAVKRCLLDQTLISGVGNIYADEALWRARLHGERPGSALTRAQAATLLAEVRAVLAESIKAGGTSFDALYVNVNGQSGYFERSLNAYGREGEPCNRCGRPIRRAAFMNRSSFFCPSCQRAPR